MPTISLFPLVRAAAILALTFTAAQAQSLTWTQRTTGVTAGLQYTSAAYGAGKYAVVAYGNGTTSGTFQSQVATSTDAITWNVVTLPTAPVVRGIAYGGGLWLVPAERNGDDAGNTQNILTSPDGTTWTARTTGIGSLWKVAHTTMGSGNLYVAVGLANSGFNAVYSTDATTWTRVSISGATANLSQLAGGNGTIVAGGATGGTVHTSTNGSTWTNVTLPGQGASNFMVGLVYAGGEFIAAVRTLTGATQLFTSPNGTTWTAGVTASGAPANFSVNGLGASGAATSGSARIILVGGAFDPMTLTGTPSILTATATLATWTSQAFGSGDFASNNFALFANDLWLVGSNATQLHTAPATASPTPYTSGHFANLSVRAQAGTGESTLILGVVINGSSGTKPLLVRAAGPSLSGYNVATYLADPSLSVYQGSTVLAQNNDWDAANTSLTGATAAVGAFPFATGSTDAALLRDHAPGSYTIQIGGGSGIALAEFYDRDASLTTATPRFVNASARGAVGTGANVLIAGFVVTGTTSQKVLVRAAGPALTGQGITTALADPKLTLYRGGTLVAENDNWSSTTTADQTAAGATAFTAGSKDSALVQTLTPGIYTAIVSSVTGATGVALVELYELP